MKGLAIAFVTAMLSACVSTGTATTGPQSCLFSGVTQLMYPIPGATNVPDSPPEVVFASSQLFPSYWAANLDGTTAAFVQIDASQVPRPSAVVQISNPYYEAATFGAPFSSGVHRVSFADTQAPCLGSIQGSFTAQ